MTPIMLSTMSVLSLGTQSAGLADPVPTSGTMTNDPNHAYYYPFRLPSPITVVKMYVYNGTVVDGTLDLGIYNADWVLLTSSGATTQTGTSTLQEFDVTDIELDRGRYYFGMNASSQNATFFQTLSTTQAHSQIAGFAHQDTAAATLPAVATPISADTFTWGVIIMGLATRTLVA